MNRPANFTPLLLRRIGRAARMGLSAEAMAKQFLRDVSSIESICRKHGIAITGIARPDHVPGRSIAAEHSTIGVKLMNEHLTVLEREAARRGTTAPLLAGEILNLIAQDGLFAAVLD